jgi:hypothetical protein
MTGPAQVSHRDQVRAIEAAIGEEITIRQVTREQAREHYRRQGGWAAANADFILGFQTYSGAPAEPDADRPHRVVVLSSSVEQITGRPARTFQDWAHDHAQDFR